MSLSLYQDQIKFLRRLHTWNDRKRRSLCFFHLFSPGRTVCSCQAGEHGGRKQYRNAEYVIGCLRDGRAREMSGTCRLRAESQGSVRRWGAIIKNKREFEKTMPANGCTSTYQREWCFVQKGVRLHPACKMSKSPWIVRRFRSSRDAPRPSSPTLFLTTQHDPTRHEPPTPHVHAASQS